MRWIRPLDAVWKSGSAALRPEATEALVQDKGFLDPEESRERDARQAIERIQREFAARVRATRRSQEPHTGEMPMDFKNITELEDYLKRVLDDAIALFFALKLIPFRREGIRRGDATASQVSRIEVLQRKVAEHFERLPGCLAYLEKEIHRLSNNLAIVQANEGRLHDSRVRSRFAEAREALQAEHGRAVNMHRVLLTKVIVQVDRVLRWAAAKGFAGSSHTASGLAAR